MNKDYKQISFNFDKNTVLVSDIYNDSDGKRITYQTFRFEQMPMSCSIIFSGAITPQKLRELADILEKELE